MTVQECLTDELEYLNGLMTFFELTKYEYMLLDVKNRIRIVLAKLENIQPESDTIY